MSVLLLAGIQEILIISTPDDIPHFRKLLGDGNQIGVKFHCAIQETPRGLADAFIIGEDFIGNDDVCLVLGDNVFYGHSLSDILYAAINNLSGATVFGYPVKNNQFIDISSLDIW